MSFKQIRDRFNQGKFEEAYHLLKLEPSNFELRAMESLILEELGEMQSSYDLALDLQDEAQGKFQNYLANISQANILYRRGQYEELEKYIPLINPENIKFDKVKPDAYWNLRAYEINGFYNHLKGNYDEAYDYYVRVLEIATVIETSYIAYSYINLGEIQMDREEYDSAFDYFTRALENAKNIGSHQITAYGHYNLGRILQIQGKIQHSLDHYESGLVNFKESQKLSGQVLCLNAIGEIHSKQGTYHIALETFEKALLLSEELETESYFALISTNLGKLDFNSKKNISGENWFVKAKNIWRDIGNDLEVANVLYELILRLLEENQEEKVLEYMNEFKEVSENSGLKSIQVKYLILKSLLLKKKNRLISVVKAQKILEDLLDDDIKQSELRVEILLSLLEIKLFELQTFDDPEIQSELNDIISNLWELAIEEKLFPLQIDILLIEARLQLILQNYKKVGEILENAKATSSKLNNSHHTSRIEKVSTQIYDEMGKWKKLVSGSTSLKDRISQSQIMDYLQDVSKTLRDNF